MFTTVRNDQRALVYKGGNYVKMLKPGKHFLGPLLSAQVYDLEHPLPLGFNIRLHETDTELMRELDIVEVPDSGLTIQYEEGRFKQILTTGKYCFWKPLNKNEFKPVDLNIPEIDNSIDKNLLSRAAFAAHVYFFSVEPYEQGLFFADRTFIRPLMPGIYRFWKGAKEMNVQKVDLRQQQLDITGQDIMTRDKVSLRLNFICQFKVKDALKVTLDIKDYQSHLYVLMQLALREYIGSLTLDDILERKEQIGNYITELLQPKAMGLGLEIIFSGLKDIILPGDVKDIINQVLIAEKKAQANVIMRREETASTRSLLNTAKLMEENEVLFKLKELEYIERISEKVNQISLSGGGVVFLEQLKQVLLPGRTETSKEKPSN